MEARSKLPSPSECTPAAALFFAAVSPLRTTQPKVQVVCLAGHWSVVRIRVFSTCCRILAVELHSRQTTCCPSRWHTI